MRWKALGAAAVGLLAVCCVSETTLAQSKTEGILPAPVNDPQTASRAEADPRVRRYVMPARVVWHSGDKTVGNPEALLIHRSGQVTLDASNPCVLRNGKDTQAGESEKGRSGLYSSTKSLGSISLKNEQAESLDARPGFEGEKSKTEIFPPQSRPDPAFSVSVPSLVSQIADGENGGVMMNEFPGKYMEVVRQASHSATPLMNGTEYLEHLFAAGVKAENLPQLQPIMQKRIWDRFQPGEGSDKLAETIEHLKREDHRFHMEGGSWTNNISWVRGYENLLGPMEKVSALFDEKLLKPGVSPADHRFRRALYHLMASQTSCYRYWGQGMWTDYGREICRRAQEILEREC